MTPQLRKALEMERDRARLEAIGRVRASALVTQARLRAIRSYQTYQNPALVAMTVAEVLVGDYGTNTLVEVVRHGMVAGHLAGIARTQTSILERRAKRGLRLAVSESAYENALKFLRDRTGLSPEATDALENTYGSAAAGAVVKATQSATSKIGEALSASLEAGDGVKQGVVKLQQAFKDAGLAPGKDYQLEQIFRTQTQLAYSAGRQNALDDPAVQEILWGYEYVTVGDDRVRPTHRAMDGVKAEKDDPIWDRWTPPNGYNCRCAILEIFDKGTETKQPDVDPDNGFAFYPGDVSSGVVEATLPLPPPPMPIAPEVPPPTSGARPSARVLQQAKDEAEDPMRFDNPGADRQLTGKDWKTSILSLPNGKYKIQQLERYLGDEYQLFREVDSGAKTGFKLENDLAHIRSALQSAPLYQGELYRGLSLTVAEAEKTFGIGAQIQQASLSSWTKDRGIASGFAEGDQEASVIISTSQARGIDVDKLPVAKKAEDEAEVLTEKGLRYEVLDVIRSVSGTGKPLFEVFVRML